MKYIYKELKDGMVQITTSDERWYSKEEADNKKGNVKRIFVPSVTWIAGHYPKGVGFYKWLANKGWDEAEALKSSAGDKGSKVHSAVEALLIGGTVKLDSAFINPSTEQAEELTVEEYEAVMSFAQWHKEVKPKVISIEKNVIGEKFAGTVDLVCEIKNKKGEAEKWVIDFKTSQYVWPEHEIQVSAYDHLLGGGHRLGILQIGYKRNKKKFKFTEVENQFDLFEAAYKIWEKESSNQKPAQKDFPLEISLNKKSKK